MAEYFLERRTLTHPEMAADIARHLQVRQLIGKAIVVSERPAILLSSVRRQWIKITQALQRECARTLDTTLKAELLRQLKMMQELQFVAKSPYKAPEADIYFMSTDEVQQLPPACRTIYFCADDLEETNIPELIEPGCVVVEYC